MPGTVAANDGPSVTLSFANNFWGKEDAGTGPLLDRMAGAKLTGDEMQSFYRTRLQIEEEYAKKLFNLARKPLGSSEEGTLRMSLDVVRGEVESMAKQHQVMAGQMKTELDEPLTAFIGAMKERRKIVQGGVEKTLKTKNAQTMAVNKSRDRYEQDCLKVKGYHAQAHMVMGQEEKRNQAKLHKTQIQMSQNSDEYEAAVRVLEETTGKWNREWKAACDKFQDLEEERIDYFKSSLWSFANISSTVCVSDDAACEKIRLSLEDCDVEKDIMQFIKDRGTGQEIPDPPKYINFCRGDIDDAGSAHGSDDDNYSVAQFQRSMNPAYRTSSPQPSTLESHNDPDSGLREEMGIPKGRGSLQGDESFHVSARSSHGSAAPPPLNPSQASAQSNQYADIPQVPHNPYPTDGMTQFCRTAAPSDRSSVNPSPTRPDSRDSQSEYSNPTSFSSFEPTSGHASPTKQFNGSNVSSNVSSIGEDRRLEKKKSGIFHSPFRRRSQKIKDQPSQSATATPTARNTWTPATTRSANTSPTKTPFALGNRASTWQKQPSPDPDPVDPRADYQLGIGNNVFDVASPDSRKPAVPKKDVPPELDPIAQALAELKGVKKQASTRQSADTHYGMSTPAPPGADSRGLPAGAVPTPFANKSARATPPPAYDQPVSRLGAPQPAHTSREMLKTTERFTNQKRDVFNTGVPSRPGSSMGDHPPRSASPRPFVNGDQRGQQPPYRAASPNPYGGQPVNRARAPSNSPQKQQPNYGGYNSRGGSPGQHIPRAASPNPAYNPRPASSNGAVNGGMALQLAPSGGQDPYAGGSQRGGRPQSSYYGGGSEASYASNQSGASRTRSQSVGAQRQVTRNGQPILHYSRAMYMYQRAIPEELSFAKGDILAVTRHQDDGWWEAELVGKNEPPGLVPSNYLKNC